MTAPRYGVVFDFDGTLTPKSLGSLFKVVDTRALPPEAEPDFKVLRDKYIPLAHAGQLSAELQEEWLAETFEIYIRHRLMKPAWMQAIEDAIVFRAGVVETIRALAEAEIPMAIISYGAADFIRHALRRADCALCSIFATRMIHGPDGLVTGYDKGTFVFQDNKGAWSRRFADLYGIPPENLLAVGDTAGDRHLGHLQENRFGIAKDAGELAVIAPFMGASVVSDDFSEARAWLASKLGLPL